MERFENKRESGVSRVIGTESEEKILEFFKEKFESDRSGKFDKEHEPELDEVILFLNEHIGEFLRDYGVSSIDIPPRNIHIVDKSKLTPEMLEFLRERYEKTSGLYIPSMQHIGILKDYTEDTKLEFLQTLVHEMIHMNSFLSFQKVDVADKGKEITLEKEYESGAKENIPLGVRRMGFEIHLPDRAVLFRDINEAITTELTIRFDNRYFGELPALKEELGKREEAREAIKARKLRIIENDEGLPDILSAVVDTGNDEKGRQKFQLRGHPYMKERKQLNNLIDDLFEKNNEEFSSREEVFNMFAKVVMTGRLLPVARLIEKTYGKGSFRKLGSDELPTGPN